MGKVISLKEFFIKKGFRGLRKNITALCVLLTIIGILLGQFTTVVEASDKQVSLRVAVYAEPARTIMQQRLVEAFENKYPNIKIVLESADFSTYYTKLNTNIAARNIPDVFMMSGAYFYNIVSKGVLKDLTPLLEAEGISLDDYFWEPENTYYQGKIYGLPHELAVLALAYNLDIFDKFGVAYPTDDWAWDDILDASLKLTKSEGSEMTYGIYSPNNSQEWWGNLIKQNGGSFLTPDKKKGALDSPEAIEALKFAIDLIYKYKVSPTPQGASSLPGYIESGGSPFMTGLVAMKFQGNYELGLLTQQDKFRWDVVTMPKQKVKGGLRWTQSWVMSDQTKYPEEAWTFIKYYLSEEFQKILAETPNKGITPPLKKVAYSSPFIDPPPNNMAAFLDTAEYGFDFEYHPAWFEYQSAYSRALAPVFEGKGSVEDAVKQGVKEVNDILARYTDFQP
jgi:multiple sugar transport system substrate-binding protein